MADRFRTAADWEDVRFFAALARHGSLSGAARALAVNHATVARRVAGLEHSLGAKLIEQETDLDKQFASHTVTSESLKASTAAVAATQGALRETHLKYHLSTVAILTPRQMQRYAELCGYGEKPMHHHH